MIQIRKGVFETNSSSTHSICISKEKVNAKDVAGKKVHFGLGDYGWEFTCVNDCGPDYYIFGHPLCIEYDHLYDFDNAEANDAYLKTFEEGKAEISMRQRVSIWYLNIAPCVEETA